MYSRRSKRDPEVTYRKKIDPVIYTHNKYHQVLDGDQTLVSSILGGKFFKEDKSGPSAEAIRYARNQTGDHDKRQAKDPVHDALTNRYRQTLDRDGSGRSEISAIVAGAGQHVKSAAPRARKDFISENIAAAKHGGRGGATPRQRRPQSSTLHQHWGARRAGRELFAGGPARPRSITPNREIAEVVRLVRETKRPQTAGVPTMLRKTKNNDMGATLPRGPGEGRKGRPSESHAQFLKLATQSFGDLPDLEELRARGAQTTR